MIPNAKPRRHSQANRRLSRAKLRIILVDPEYELNLGAAARLMRNFGQFPLYLVRPVCSLGFTARMHAKHAKDVLEKAVVCKTLEEAVKGCSQVVGTTGILQRHREALRHPLTLEEFRVRVAGQKTTKPMAILFGREGIGLKEEEIARCDVLITIPTTKKYPVMNLSHAIAVVLYALAGQEKKQSPPGPAGRASERKYLLATFDALVTRYSHRLRHPEMTKLSFKRLVGRAVPDEAETRGVILVLKQALRELEGEKLNQPPTRTRRN
jgi:tRNA/rRNA methyltransferase